jgi:hypothetical protein
MKTNVFKLEVVLSSIYGILLCDIGDVYQFLNFVLNTELFTHQLPKAGKQARPLIEAQYPFLAEIDLTGINPDNWKQRLSEIKAKCQDHNFLEIVSTGNYEGGLFSDLDEMLNKEQSVQESDTTDA